MEFTEKEQKQLAATPWLNENQKQAVSLLRSLSEEEVAEVIEWTTPILVCLPSTNDVKQTLQEGESPSTTRQSRLWWRT